MEDISEVKIEINDGNNNFKSKFVKLQRMHYKQNGIKKIWDMVDSNDSVSALLYHRKKQCFILVKQFRPPVYARQLKQNNIKQQIKEEITLTNRDTNDVLLTTEEDKSQLIIEKVNIKQELTDQRDNENLSPNLSFELCAGLMDKEKHTNTETIQAEILEECGYKVPIDEIKFVNHFFLGTALSASVQYFYYAEVTDEYKVSEGGGVVEEGEMIETFELNLEKCYSFMRDDKIVKNSTLLYALSWWILEVANSEEMTLYNKGKNNKN
ncbi:hypothetical protein ABK040_000573 [Willaertia magna]